MKGNKGFTLIELIIVLVVLGILASIGIPIYMTTLERARATEAIEQINEIKSSQDARALSQAAYADTLMALGYPDDPWTPQTNWTYSISVAVPFTAAQPGIIATKAVAPSLARTVRMQLGAIVDGQPGAATWEPDAANAHPGQP